MTPGERLRKLRETLGLSVRAVEAASNKIAARHGNPDYLIPISRLSDIETKGVLPSLYRLYSLSTIYREDYRVLLEMFEIHLDAAPADLDLTSVEVTHKAGIFSGLSSAKVPLRLDPSFDPASTMSLGRMIVSWGTAPMSYLRKFADVRSFTYGFVGENDWTMYPLILPGSFIQVDESRSKIVNGPWRSEYERPVYFLETREGCTCCWCDLRDRVLTLIPHPLSAVPPRSLRFGLDVEVIGQVVGVAMRLDGRKDFGQPQ